MIWCTSKVVTARNRNSSSWNKVLAEGGLYAGKTLTEARLLDSAAALAPTEVKNSLNSFASSVISLEYTGLDFSFDGKGEMVFLLIQNCFHPPANMCSHRRPI